jgi:hypothetical protein
MRTAPNRAAQEPAKRLTPEQWLALRPKLPPLDPQQRYSVAEGIAYLRSSRKSFYDDVNAGRIKLIKDGRRSYVHGSELIRRSALPREAA